MMQQQQAAGPNRALRRLQQRAKPNPKARQPREVMVNALDVVKNRAARLTDQERAAALAPARLGFTALREGVATFQQWVHVNTAIAIALAIERQGVIRGMHEHFVAADRAIDAIYARVQDAEGGPAWGRRTTLYFDEISALREAIHLHDEQLRVLSATELQQAIVLAEKHTRKIGGRVLRAPADATPEQIQEILI